jgi:hypothetical protein
MQLQGSLICCVSLLYKGRCATQDSVLCAVTVLKTVCVATDGFASKASCHVSNGKSSS